MKKRRNSIFICFILLIGCKSYQEKESSAIIEDSIEIRNPIVKENTTRKINFLDISESEFDLVLKRSRIGNILVHELGSNFQISSDGSLTYYILGNEYTDAGLQENFGNIFEIEHISIRNAYFDDVQVISKLVYKDSFIKTYFNQSKMKIDIVSGIINDPAIELVMGIKVGMSKQDFFSKIFRDAAVYDFSGIKTFENGNETGEVQQVFQFHGDTLRQITFKSLYDWIPFDL